MGASIMQVSQYSILSLWSLMSLRRATEDKTEKQPHWYHSGSGVHQWTQVDEACSDLSSLAAAVIEIKPKAPETFLKIPF